MSDNNGALKTASKTKKAGELKIIIGSFIFSIALAVIGIFCRDKIAANVIEILEIVYFCLLFLPVLYAIAAGIIQAVVIKKIKSKNVAEIQQYALAHRENAAEVTKNKLKALKRVIVFNDVFSVLLLVIGFGCSFLTGVLVEEISVGASLEIFAFMYIACALTRVRTAHTSIFNESVYVGEKQFPEIYKIVKSAAEKLQIKGKINVAILDGCNAGIAKFGKQFSVQLGVDLLNIMTDDELYAVLLHEFTHIKMQTKDVDKIFNYNVWASEHNVESGFLFAAGLLFGFIDFLFEFNYMFYQYASSVSTEYAADEGMLKCGNKAVVASALTKLKYYELFTWEDELKDWTVPLLFEKPEPSVEYVAKRTADFNEQLKLRMDDWNHLSEVEIIARSASHPTFKMRFEALGLEKACSFENEKSEAYAKDCKNAIEFIGETIKESISKFYADERKECYFEPLSEIMAWENEGKPLKAEEYMDIIDNLHFLCRFSEAEQFCDRAIAELNGSAAAFAYFKKAQYQLHRFEDEGIENMYRAIDLNRNAIDSGLTLIGIYCCLTGNQKKLDEYREKAVLYTQKQMDESEQLQSLKRGDKLESVNLPEGKLEELLGYVRESSDGLVEKLYIANKIISADSSVNVVVLQFVKNANAEKREEIYHKVFCYLDVQEEDYSLFYYESVDVGGMKNLKNSCHIIKN